MTLYKGKSIANGFLVLGCRDGQLINPLKLQSLLYFANGYYMAENLGQALVNEYFEAWDYGPVIPSVYYEFKEYKDLGIKRFASTWNVAAQKLTLAPVPFRDRLASEMIAWVWDTCKSRSDLDLSHMMQKLGSPWDRARKRAEYSGMRNEPLAILDIHKHFSNLTSVSAAAVKSVAA